MPLENFQQEFECHFVDESYRFYPYNPILPCTSEELVLATDVTDIKAGDGRFVAGFGIGRIRDRSELALFEDRDGRMICRLLRCYDQVPFSEEGADLRRLLEHLPLARLSIGRRGCTRSAAEAVTPGRRGCGGVWPRYPRPNGAVRVEERHAGAGLSPDAQGRRYVLPPEAR